MLDITLIILWLYNIRASSSHVKLWNILRIMGSGGLIVREASFPTSRLAFPRVNLPSIGNVAGEVAGIRCLCPPKCPPLGCHFNLPGRPHKSGWGEWKKSVIPHYHYWGSHQWSCLVASRSDCGECNQGFALFFRKTMPLDVKTTTKNCMNVTQGFCIIYKYPRSNLARKLLETWPQS